jgi:hypothetical protein
MTVMQQFTADLTQAARRRASREITLRRRARLTGLAVTGALTLGASVAAATAVWQPQLGDERRGQPTTDFSAPPAEELAALGVLRRESTPGDRGAQSIYALRLLDPSLRGVRTSYVRLLGSEPNGNGFVLIPVQSYYAADAGAPSIANALCVFSRDSDGGGLGCYSMQQVLEGRAVGSLVHASQPGAPTAASPPSVGSHFMREQGSLTDGVSYGLVPDGVASVTLTNRQGTITVPVRENFFETSLPTTDGSDDGRATKTSTPAMIQWRSAAGRVIATVSLEGH